MTVRCPSCSEPFGVAREDEGKATAPCPRCGRIVVIGPAARAEADDPQTEPHLERLAPLSLPAGKRVSVVVASGPRKGNRVSLDRPRLTLGQAGAGADLEVPDPDISPSHAAIECHGARIVLRDLGSRAGTFVGDERVSQLEIEDQTEFRLAATTFLLLVAEQ